MIAQLLCTGSYTLGFIIAAIMTMVSMIMLADNERFKAILILFGILIITYFIGLLVQGSLIYVLGV
jgi:heme/copper-type cytochrome/quinol oxidase subunit 4